MLLTFTNSQIKHGDRNIGMVDKSYAVALNQGEMDMDRETARAGRFVGSLLTMAILFVLSASPTLAQVKPGDLRSMR